MADSPLPRQSATTAQEEAATRMLRQAFGPVLAAIGGRDSAFEFWGPRVALAVIEAVDAPPEPSPPSMSREEKNRVLDAILAELEAL